MMKLHCDACEGVIGEGACLPATAKLVTIPEGFNISVQLLIQKPGKTVDLCRRCEALAAQEWLTAVIKDLNHAAIEAGLIGSTV
jgi:hypothetical protein